MALLYGGWETRIRTLVGGVRVRSPTARRSPIGGESYTNFGVGRQGLIKTIHGFDPTGALRPSQFAPGELVMQHIPVLPPSGRFAVLPLDDLPDPPPWFGPSAVIGADLSLMQPKMGGSTQLCGDPTSRRKNC